MRISSISLKSKDNRGYIYVTSVGGIVKLLLGPDGEFRNSSEPTKYLNFWDALADYFGLEKTKGSDS